MNVVEKIIQWHHDRNLIEGATDKDQFVKLAEEMGELASNINKAGSRPVSKTKALIADDLGDMMVIMLNIMVRNDLTLDYCMEVAYNDIKDRKGKMIDGIFVKEADLVATPPKTPQVEVAVPAYMRGK